MLTLICFLTLLNTILPGIVLSRMKKECTHHNITQYPYAIKLWGENVFEIVPNTPKQTHIWWCLYSPFAHIHKSSHKITLTFKTAVLQSLKRPMQLSTLLNAASSFLSHIWSNSKKNAWNLILLTSASNSLFLSLIHHRSKSLSNKNWVSNSD